MSAASVDYAKIQKDLGLSIGQIDMLLARFRLIDRDGSGSVSLSELMGIVQQLGLDMTEAEVREMMEAVDKDGNGCIEPEEFVYMIGKRMQSVDEQDLLEAYRVWDRDGDGRLTVEEFRAVIENLIPSAENPTEEEIIIMFEEADEDMKGYVDFEDFVRIVEWIAPSSLLKETIPETLEKEEKSEQQ